MVIRKRKPAQPKPPEEIAPEEVPATPDHPEETGDDRTVIFGEYRGGKVKIFFGQKGTVIKWAIAWSIAVLSAMLAAGMFVTILENLKRIGVLK